MYEKLKALAERALTKIQASEKSNNWKFSINSRNFRATQLSISRSILSSLFIHTFTQHVTEFMNEFPPPFTENSKTKISCAATTHGASREPTSLSHCAPPRVEHGVQQGKVISQYIKLSQHEPHSVRVEPCLEIVVKLSGVSVVGKEIP